jgi:hypothetical protein
MMIVLLVAAYIAVAALCVYLEGRITGESRFAPMWLMWPVFLPLVVVVVAFKWIGDLGERHHG